MIKMPFDGIVTYATTNELHTKLTAGKITKIYQPTETEVLFTIRNRGQNTVLLCSIHPTYSRIHLTEEMFQNPKEPPMFCMVLRKYLSGAIIKKIEQRGLERIIQFTIHSRNEIGDITEKKLIMEIMGRHSNLLLVDGEDGHIIDSLKHVSSWQNRHRTILPGQTYQLPPEQNKLNPLLIRPEQLIKKLDFNAGKLDTQIVNLLSGFSPVVAKEIVHQAHLGNEKVYEQLFTDMQQQLLDKDFTPVIYRNQKEDYHVLPLTHLKGEKQTFLTTNSMLDQFYTGKAERDRVKQQTKDLARLLKNELAKNKRKQKKHAQTMQKAQRKEHYQKAGELLTAHLHLVTQGDKQITVVDYYDPEQKQLTIDLDPLKTPSENAQAYFKTYQKLKTSELKVKEEIAKTEQEMEYLERLLQQIETASIQDIEEIREELRDEGYLKKQKATKKKKAKTAKPVPEKYIASDGTTILVGKNNKQNEYVTMKLAARDDIWLHTKDIPGSHVIIRSATPSEDTILEAAQLAAYFSKSRQSSSVPVDYTKIRHVKKPNGAKPGFVTYDNQKTVFVTPNEQLIHKLTP